MLSWAFWVQGEGQAKGGPQGPPCARLGRRDELGQPQGLRPVGICPLPSSLALIRGGSGGGFLAPLDG